jgi:imidazolonepropionase-like amidohydrolase
VLRRIRVEVFVVFLAVGGSSGLAAAATLIENVHVITMVGEGAPFEASVLVEGDRIVAVDDPDAIETSADVQRIDGKGGYLLPGFTDMHNHVDSPESLKLQLAYGVTTIRNMWGSDEILAQREAERAGKLLAPDIETVSPIIDDEPPYFKGSLTISDPDEADTFVSDLKAQGYSALKTYELVREDVYVALAAAAERYGMTIEGHIPQAVDAFDAVVLGHDTVEHSMRVDAAIVAPGIPYSNAFRSPELVELVRRIDAGELTYEEAYRRDMLRALARLMVDNGTALVPTLGVYEILSYSASDREAMAGHPLIDYVNPVFKPFWLDADPPGEELTNEGVMAELTDEQIASLEYYAGQEHGNWVGIMHAEGVLVLAGVDAPNPGMFQGYSLHDELGHMVHRAGLSNYEALKTATVNPAAYWGIEGERGVVASGAEADLILLEANPLGDIANTKRIRGVMADGRWLDRGDLDALLEDVRSAYAEMAEQLATGAEAATGFPVHLHGRH